MNARFESLLWLLQRASAMILGVAVAVHLGIIVRAVRGGLTGHEIVERLQSNTAWFAFYVVFAAAVAVHGSIGLRTVLREMTPLPMRVVDAVTVVLVFLLVSMGWRAAAGLYGFGT